MAADLDSASAICSSHHSWHIGSDSGVASAPILFPEGIWHQADVRLSEYQDPFCYIADLWRSIAELWQPLWFGLFSHLAFPVLTEWCCFCHWWYDWDKGWPLPTQFQLPAWSWRLIGDVWGGVPRALNPAHLAGDMLAPGPAVPASSVCEAMWAFETGGLWASPTGVVLWALPTGVVFWTPTKGVSGWAPPTMVCSKVCVAFPMISKFWFCDWGCHWSTVWALPI